MKDTFKLIEEKARKTLSSGNLTIWHKALLNDIIDICVKSQRVIAENED